MRRFVAVFLVWIGMGVDTSAQIIPSRLDVAGSYLFAGSMSDGVTRSSGPGVAVSLDFQPTRIFGVAIGAQLHRLAITQNEAIDRWDWAYWELEWRNQSQILLRSPDYTAEQIPVQNATMMSGSLMPSLSVGGGRVDARIAAGPSLTYFARSLYLDEHWSRYYPESDHTVDMAFRTYAEDKTGYEIGVDARVSADYRLSSLFALSAGVHYRRFLSDDGARLPLNDFVALQLALAFRY